MPYAAVQLQRGNWYLCGFWSPCTVAISGINDAWLEVCSSHSLLRGCWRWDWDYAEGLMGFVIFKAMAWLVLNSPMVWAYDLLFYKTIKLVKCEEWDMKPTFSFSNILSNICIRDLWTSRNLFFYFMHLHSTLKSAIVDSYVFRFCMDYFQTLDTQRY